MKKVYLTLAFFLIGFVLTAQKLPFQGYLEESGVPVNGTRSFTFNLTDYGWSETLTAVPIDNGIYNVVLGQITLLPDTIFSNVSETPLSITVDSTNIGTLLLYKPLGFDNSKFELLNAVDSKRGELIVNDTDAGELSLYGVNDSLNIRLGSFSGGYYGNLGIYDSLGVSNGFIRARNNGGLLQLNKLDATGNFASAILASTNPVTSALLLYAQNPTADNVSKMIENYTATREIFNGPLMSNNYKRSGTDWYDNEGRILAAVGNAREETGDPEGGSGYVSLWGKNSFNVQLAGKRWQNNDFPTFELFGNSDDGGTWWMRNFAVEVFEAPIGYDYTNMSLFNTDVGGISHENVFITSNLYEQKGGGIEIRDSIGTTNLRFEGNSGNIYANNIFGNITPNNGSLFRLNYGDGTQFVNADPSTTRFVVHNPSGGQTARIFSSGSDGNFGRFRLYGNDNETHHESGVDDSNAGYTYYYGPGPNFFPIARIEQNGVNPEAGSIKLFSNNVETINLNAETGIGNFLNAAIGQQTNGIVHIYGEDNTAIDNLRLQMEVRPDGLGSSYGFIEVRDAAFNTTISIDGSTGTVTATTLTQTSDKRLKKDINTLENSLSNTLKLRGTSYYWKDQNKSQKRQIGVIAQEVEEVYPEFVHTDEKGMKAVNYAQMTAVLIEAIKELNQKIVHLENENQKLSTALNETKQLSNRLAKLEKLLLENNTVVNK